MASLPPSGHSYMEKTFIIVIKNISLTLGSNPKTKLKFFDPRSSRGFYSRVSFSAKLSQAAFSGRDAENCLK